MLSGSKSRNSKREVLGEGGAVRGEAIKVDGRVGAVRALAEDRDEEGEVVRVQDQVRVVDDAYDPDTARDFSAQVAQAVHQSVPVRAVVAGKLENFREATVDSLLGHQLAGVEVVDASSGGFQALGSRSESWCACGAEDYEGFRARHCSVRVWRTRAHRLRTVFQASITA